MNLPFNSKTQWQMFLLVSGGHVGAHPDGHQHAAFTESALSCSIILGKQFLKFFTCEKSFWPESWRGSFYINLIHFSDSGIYRFIFIFASVTVKTNNKTKRVSSGVKLVWNHTRENQMSAQGEFDLISQAWFQTTIARHEAHLPL